MDDNNKKENTFRLVDRWDKPIAEYDIREIGPCRVCSMTWGDEREFAKLYPKPINEYNPDELARFTLRFIVRKNKEDKGPSLSEEEARLIPDQLKEEIFEKLLAHSSYLYKENTSTTETDEKGTRIVKLSEGEVIYPRNEGETAIQYYQRVKHLHEEKQAKKFKEMFKKMNFSTGLNDQILKSMKSLDQIISPIKSMDHLINPFKTSLTDVLRNHEKNSKIEFSPADTFRHINLEMPEDHQLNTMRDIRDDISDNHVQSMSVFAEISQTLIGMLNELQGSTKDTNKSLRIALYSLVATVLIGFAQLWVDVKNDDLDIIKVELQKSYRKQEELMERIGILESQKREHDQLILAELKELNSNSKGKK